MLEIYLLCGIVGLGWSVVTFALGQIAHAEAGHDLHLGGSFGEGGHGDATASADAQGALPLPLFSPTAIAGWLTGFGATGYGLHGGLGIGNPLVHVPISIAGATGMALLVSWATVKLLQLGDVSSAAGAGSRLGRSGELSVGIPAGGLGEVSYLGGPALSSAPARSLTGDEIPRGRRVRIVREEGAVLVVEPAEEDGVLQRSW